jgi:ABC-type glycerol-3-phosphate transport system substrate-binding protein
MHGADEERLIREGLLEDLLLLIHMNDNFSWDMVLPGVLLTMSRENSLYSFPVSFSTNALNLYDKSTSTVSLPDDLPLPWTWDVAVEYFIPEMEKRKLNYLISMTPQQMALKLTMEYHSYFFDVYTGIYNFDNSVFKEILETVNKFYIKGLLRELDYNIMMGQPEASLIISYPEGDGLLIMDIQGSLIRDYSNISSSRYNASGNIMYPLPQILDTSGMAIVPSGVYAISRNAPNKLAAWEFIKILLSDDIQDPAKMLVQPVLSVLSEPAVQSAIKMGIPATTNNTLEQSAVDEYNNDRYNYFSNINRIHGDYIKPDISDIIIKYSKAYFKQEYTLDETIKFLQDEVGRLD